MKQHAAAVSFPAAAIVVVVTWIIGHWWTVPAEVSAALVALTAWAAVELGLSRDQPPVDPVTGEANPPRPARRRRRR